MSSRYKVICGCECCISIKKKHSPLLSWYDRCLKYINHLSQNAQSRRSGETDNFLFETNKNSVMPHGRHIHTTADDMAMTTIFAYPLSPLVLKHWKCVLHCCCNLLYIDLTDK